MYIQSVADPNARQSSQTAASGGAEKSKSSPVPMLVITNSRRKSSPVSVRVVFVEVMGVKPVHWSVTGAGSPTRPPWGG